MPGSLIWVIPMAAAAGLWGWVITSRVNYTRRKLRLKIQKKGPSAGEALVGYFRRHRWMERLMDWIAVRVSMFTAHSARRNRELAALVMIWGALVMLLMAVAFLSQSHGIWYVMAANVVLVCLFLITAVYLSEVAIRHHFTSKIPRTYKLINARYTSKGNILKAIAASMEDFDRVVSKEMKIVYNVLRKNDMEEIDQTFKGIEAAYRDPYLTLLLNLIRQAHYKGGETAIRSQFEQATEDVLLEIENRKDLAAASRSYIFLALPMPFLMKGVEMFNLSAIGDQSNEFYSSPTGLSIKLAFLFSIAVFAAFMVYLERTV